MGKMKTELGKVALECIVTVLESYMEFVGIAETYMCFAEATDKITDKMRVAIKQRRKNWEPVLQEIKKELAEKDV